MLSLKKKLMKKLFMFFFLTLISCKNEVNQYQTVRKNVKLKTGKWVEKDDYPDQKYVSIGKYKKGEKTGVWKVYLNGALYQKDKFKDSITRTKFYYPDGKILKKGVSKTIEDHQTILWYYHGKWNFMMIMGNWNTSKLITKTVTKRIALISKKDSIKIESFPRSS